MPVDLRACCLCPRAVARYHKEADTCGRFSQCSLDLGALSLPADEDGAFTNIHRQTLLPLIPAILFLQYILLPPVSARNPDHITSFFFYNIPVVCKSRPPNLEAGGVGWGRCRDGCRSNPGLTPSYKKNSGHFSLLCRTGW